MAVKFFSKEWELAMQKGLEEEFSTRGMVTTVFVQVLTDGPDGKNYWALTELKKGKYVRYEIGEDEPPAYELAAVGTYAVHKGCVTKELDGSVCITTGQMTLEGKIK